MPAGSRNVYISIALVEVVDTNILVLNLIVELYQSMSGSFHHVYFKLVYSVRPPHCYMYEWLFIA